VWTGGGTRTSAALWNRRAYHPHVGVLTSSLARPRRARLSYEQSTPGRSIARTRHTPGVGSLARGRTPHGSSPPLVRRVMLRCAVHVCITGVDHTVVAKTPVRAAPAVGWSGDTAGLPLPRVRQASESRYRRRGGGQWSRPYGHPLWCPATIPSRVSPLAHPPLMPTSCTSPRTLLLLADDGCPSPPTRTERATGVRICDVDNRSAHIHLIPFHT